MSERRRRAILILIMACVSFSIATITVLMLYWASFDEARNRLVEIAKSQARLIEAIAIFDSKYSQDYPGGAEAATLSQIQDAHGRFEGFAESGEFTLAKREGETIKFLLRHRHAEVVMPESIPFHSELAEPMRLALSGKSGTIVGLDYRRVKVLAAYEPVKVLNFGIVAKMDLAEVRKPFLRTGIVALLSALLLVIVGAIIFFRLSEPMIKRLEERVSLLQERNHVQDELRKQRRQTELILNTAGEGIYGLDLNGNTTFVNPAAAKYIGWEVDEIIGKNQHQVLHHSKPDGTPYPSEECPIYAAYRDGIVHHVDDEVFWRRDGSSFPVEYVSAPIRNEHGKIEGAVVTFSDITKRRQAEKELRESREQLKLSIDGMLEAYGLHEAIFDEDGRMVDYRFLEFNPAAQKIAGITRDEIVGKTALELFPHVVERGLMKRYADVMETGKSDYIEDFYYEGDNLNIAFDISCFKIDAKHFVCVFRDITDRKKAALELELYSEHLEKMVEERTRELEETQEQLVRKEKLAILGQLAGGVGHELRNPLGVISNAIFYLKSVMPDAEQNIREYFGIISSEVGNAEKIVSGLLDFSRTKAAQKDKVNISEIIDTVFEKLPPPESIELYIEIASDLPPLFVDRHQIDQVFFNLVSNAYQAMPEGGKLSIEATIDESDVRIAIIDTGPGMSLETQSKIFEPLFTTKAKGIGLGLSLSKNLVEMNKGKIRVESKEGEGTKFTVILPTWEEQS